MYPQYAFDFPARQGIPHQGGNKGHLFLSQGSWSVLCFYDIYLSGLLSTDGAGEVAVTSRPLKDGEIVSVYIVFVLVAA